MKVTLHRFRDRAAVAITGTGGETVYLDVAGTRALQRAAAMLAESLEGESFTESSFAPVEIEAHHVATAEPEARAMRAAGPPVPQGPEGNGHDLPTCRACGWPGSDDHENCPNCAPVETEAHRGPGAR